ncbi:hypothetical protein HHI36_015041 [Cryptolaemus montrouzieri]|uniref:Arginyl-tRNA--protein transferase 1 n=1 Tax=Cryptolaemus montrouzieri TaxID=559131 RepID=A0ABD2N4K8_9CUCU
MGDPRSIVYWFPDKESQKCGYCKNVSGSVQYGMWAQSLTVEDYQNLINRGWRRSGQYCYKPILDETCCPLYTIRCDALEFHLSKSQKKVIKKMNKFLKTGVLKESAEVDNSEENEGEEQGFLDNYKDCPKKAVDFTNITQMEDDELKDQNDKIRDIDIKLNVVQNSESVNRIGSDSPKGDCSSPKAKAIKKGVGVDPNKPPCKKAKIMRREKKLNKLGNSGNKIEQSSVNQQQQIKSLEQFMEEVSADDKHKLTIKLIEPTNPNSEWKKYEQLEFELFRKYQNIIHNDPPHKNTSEGFIRFLVNTPLQRQRPPGSLTCSDTPAYGSYHQQYWLDQKLIAVGVIDILPNCVSAVYFFYDPDYRELTLGTFGALKEIQLSRELFPTLNTQYYYMGFYIHTCIKMRYKGNMTPSFLLCPETYIWFPIEKCLQKLDRTKYSRFNEEIQDIDVNACSSQDLDDIKIVVGSRFTTYKRLKPFFNRDDVYGTIGKLIGKQCAKNMFFVEK